MPFAMWIAKCVRGRCVSWIDALALRIAPMIACALRGGRFGVSPDATTVSEEMGMSYFVVKASPSPPPPFPSLVV